MNNSSPIRVLLVEDSSVALELISRILSTDPRIEIVGTARNGVEALHLIPLVKPTIICTDYFMPQMDGLELTKIVMQECPIPILVISSILNVNNSKETFSILEAGALDCIEKPSSVQGPLSKSFLEKIHILSGVFVAQKKQSKTVPKQIFSEVVKQNYKVIVIGSSTGGPSVLSTILKTLPAEFAIPILCIQHMSKGFLNGFVEWLKSQCHLNVTILSDEEKMKRKHIYVPAEGTHLVIDDRMQLKCLFAPPTVEFHTAINTTMESVAHCFGKEAIAILLTGMGEDGALGMKAIKESGGITIAQNEASCPVFGMPKAAIDMGAAEFVMDPSEISLFLKKISSN